jgi:hypothetical protein
MHRRTRLLDCLTERHLAVVVVQFLGIASELRHVLAGFFWVVSKWCELYASDTPVPPVSQYIAKELSYLCNTSANSSLLFDSITGLGNRPRWIFGELRLQ